MKYKFTRPLIGLAAIAALGTGVGIATIVSASSVSTTNTTDSGLVRMFDGNRGNHVKPVVAGKVTSINNSTITIAGKDNANYAVDVSQAKFLKDGSHSTLTDIDINDFVAIEGTLNGNTVSATKVMSGLPQGMVEENMVELAVVFMAQFLQ